ncbi:TonB-dependent receptor plug domain-containing protein [Caulobacter segnis]
MRSKKYYRRRVRADHASGIDGGRIGRGAGVLGARDRADRDRPGRCGGLGSGGDRRARKPASAQAIKRSADQIVDSVQAQDIGKLPDANTTEALQRITGVQIQRRYGEGATDFDHRTQPAVTVRGLTQVQNFLDGRAVYSASGGRAFDLEGVPPELLSGIDVYKNAPANIIEGGVGGAVNLRTRKPFDAAGRVLQRHRARQLSRPRRQGRRLDLGPVQQPLGHRRRRDGLPDQRRAQQEPLSPGRPAGGALRHRPGGLDRQRASQRPGPLRLRDL